jgi:hypothetical protein
MPRDDRGKMRIATGELRDTAFESLRRQLNGHVSQTCRPTVL